MEPDDLLCSRNARSRTPLVGRAQCRTVWRLPWAKGGVLGLERKTEGTLHFQSPRQHQDEAMIALDASLGGSIDLPYNQPSVWYKQATDEVLRQF